MKGLCSMSMPDLASDPAKAIGAALARAPVEEIERVGGGRNSRVFRLVAGGRTYALKQYPSRADDPRDRLGTEVAALRWMEGHGFSMVPRVVAFDAGANYALLSWAEGRLVREAADGDVDQAVTFLSRLHALQDASAFSIDRLATEACLSGTEIERQVRARLQSLSVLPDSPALQAFLTDRFVPELERLFAAAHERMRAAGLSFASELPHALRSLAPSDFGFHNALRDNAGNLTFIDFEYFGWDDPVKLVADILLHPGTPVGAELRLRFRTAAESLYGNDPAFATRLGAYYSLFGLRWVLILLNEFHPERWRRRQLAGATEDWGTAKTRQLRMAADLLNRICRED